MKALITKVKSKVRTFPDYSLTLFCVQRRLNQISEKPFRAVISLTLDLVIGWLVSSYLMSWMGIETIVFTDSVFMGMEMMIRNLKSLIVWMMENPGGLKLNSVLSQALGNFFLYHIHLWMTYVMLIVPLLTPYVNSILHLLHFATLSIQISVISDLFTLLTIHIHCFYAYARRLALSQYRGLVALWRLFLGKKYNPLRDRVDSADNTVEQLFLGTIIFTILLFLMPTTATFFSVFLSLKLVASAVIYVLRCCVKILQWIPEKSG